MRTIDILKSWLELSKCTIGNTFIGTDPSIEEVQEMLSEVTQLAEQKKALLDACKAMVGVIKHNVNYKVGSFDIIENIKSSAIDAIAGATNPVREKEV